MNDRELEIFNEVMKLLKQKREKNPLTFNNDKTEYICKDELMN